jgi:hypothetical protein
MTGFQVLKIVCDGNTLGLDSTQKVLHDGISVVTERDLDGSFEAMDVTVVAGSLVGFVLSHERNQFFGSPTLGLEVIIVRG